MSRLPMSKATLMIIYLILLTGISYNHVKFVKADQTLILQECHNAEVPEACMQCLESDPRSKNADKVGIAEIIVGCLRSHAQKLLTRMTTLASSTKDEVLKGKLLKCGKAILPAESDLNTAMVELKNGKYDDAESRVSEALSYEVHCDRMFGIKDKEELPQTIVYEMNIYEELSEAANRIIERL